jgi:hypothetical protein
MSSVTSFPVRVPLTIRRRPGRRTVVTPVHGEGGDAAIPTRADPALVKALAWAFRYQRLLDEAQYASISEMAAFPTASSKSVEVGRVERSVRGHPQASRPAPLTPRWAARA